MSTKLDTSGQGKLYLYLRSTGLQMVLDLRPQWSLPHYGRKLQWSYNGPPIMVVSCDGHIMGHLSLQPFLLSCGHYEVNVVVVNQLPPSLRQCHGHSLRCCLEQDSILFAMCPICRKPESITPALSKNIVKCNPSWDIRSSVLGKYPRGSLLELLTVAKS